MHPVVIHRAPWVVPVSSPIISGGGVATDDEQILETGSFDKLRRIYPDASVLDHAQCALTPGLVNAHIHLELSHIHIPKYKKEVNGFTDWIESLLSMREERGALGSEAEEAAINTMLSQHRHGVIALGDIGNTDLGDMLRREFPGIILHFNECLGRTSKTRRAIHDRITAAPPERLFTAHAPYSTHPELIQELKQRALKNNHPFPIHVAEPQSENELLCCGTGELYSFLKKRGFIDDSYQPPAGIDNHGSVQYLHGLGVLDKQTICVHCIHVTPSEVELLADTETNVCLCPGSNRYLHVGKAPVSLFLENGILPALGTDSQASNPKLSIWREMNIILEDHPGIEPADIFSMATLGGARSLGIEDRYGTLAPGRTARFLSIPVDQNITDEKMLYTYLVQQKDLHPEWINEQ